MVLIKTGHLTRARLPVVNSLSLFFGSELALSFFYFNYSERIHCVRPRISAPRTG